MQIALRKSQIVSYISYILLFIRLLFAGYLYYNYLISQTEQAPTKWWTLIEGVSDTITYIPRIKGFDDRFYKSLLFRRCISESTSGGQNIYEPDLCDVITNDNKTFLVQLKDNAGNWSDGAPVSINDLVFTYEWVMQKNIWNLPQYNNNTNVVVQKSSADTLTVTFPQASKENMMFFTDFILPSHIIKSWSREDYTKRMPTEFVTNGCATISNSRDEESLIFDLKNCPNTRIRYYQVKKYSLEKMQEDPGIMDFYVWEGTIPWYNSGRVITNNYIGLFFNMQIGKLNIYARKNLIAMINKYLYLPENSTPIIKEHFLFDSFSTTLTDKTTISSIWASAILTGIQMLPNTLSLENKWETLEKKSYTLAWFEEPLTIELSEMENVEITKAITNAWIEIPVNSQIIWKSKIILKNNENIFPWVNSLHFYDKDNKLVDAINIYYKTTQQIAEKKLIHILYFKWDRIHDHIANTIKNIIEYEWVADYFFFDAQSSLEEYNKLLSEKKYDITFQTLRLGTRKDISPLLLTDDPLINSSMYVNPNLATQIKQYFQSNMESQYNIMPIISKLYATDLPFFIMWKESKTIFWKHWLQIDENSRFDDLTVRKNILDTIVLVRKPQVTKADILNRRWFIKYLVTSLNF